METTKKPQDKPPRPRWPYVRGTCSCGSTTIKIERNCEAVCQDCNATLWEVS